MSRPGKEREEPLLFDLPLDPPEKRPAGDRKRSAPLRPPEPAPGAPERPSQPRQSQISPAAAATEEESPAVPARQPRPLPPPRAAGTRSEAVGEGAALAPRSTTAALAPAAELRSLGDEEAVPHRARVLRRLVAGLADLVVHTAVTVGVLAGIWLLGVRPALADWPALAIFLLAFSFFYVVVPLAFWGQTLGMAWAKLTSLNRDGEPLTFDQTARRWLGSLLTLVTLGIPLLLALSGRSLADRLSGSETLAG